MTKLILLHSYLLTNWTRRFLQNGVYCWRRVSLNKYPNRFVLGYVKYRIKGATERGASRILRTGSLDFPKIIKVAKEKV